MFFVDVWYVNEQERERERELSDQKWFLGNWFVTKGISLAVKSRSDRISFMHYHMQFVCVLLYTSTLKRENVLCARALNMGFKNVNMNASFTMQFLLIHKGKEVIRLLSVHAHTSTKLAD